MLAVQDTKALIARPARGARRALSTSARWHLRVHDLAGLTAFYRDGIGLAVIAQDAGLGALGVDGEVLVRLEQGATRPTSPAGLFHLAILLPSRAALADWVAHAAAARIALEGASDHLVSEALYLSDPEGNGIEIYRDRPRADWPRRDGAIKMATDRLDLQKLCCARPDAGALCRHAGWHPHGPYPSARRRYSRRPRPSMSACSASTLMVHYPGASFMASGGYHHHIAGNVWNSRGAGRARRGRGRAGVVRAGGARRRAISTRCASASWRPGGGEGAMA